LDLNTDTPQPLTQKQLPSAICAHSLFDDDYQDFIEERSRMLADEAFRPRE
jgi:hypothetical protein